jgi:hypothetical protein
VAKIVKLTNLDQCATDASAPRYGDEDHSPEPRKGRLAASKVVCVGWTAPAHHLNPMIKGCSG